MPFPKVQSVLPIAEKGSERFMPFPKNTVCPTIYWLQKREEYSCHSPKYSLSYQYLKREVKDSCLSQKTQSALLFIDCRKEKSIHAIPQSTVCPTNSWKGKWKIHAFPKKHSLPYYLLIAEKRRVFMPFPKVQSVLLFTNSWKGKWKIHAFSKSIGCLTIY